MSSFLWEIRPYFRQVAGQLFLGSAAGIVMNTAVVLPPLLLGQMIDEVLRVGRAEASLRDLAMLGLAFVGSTLLMEIARVLKRWWLMTGNARIRANIRADAMRGVLAWPMERISQTAIGDLMARMVADIDIMGVGIREFSIEMWDTVLFSISLIAAMVWLDARLSLWSLLPVPAAMLLAHRSGRWVSVRTTAARRANARLTAALHELLASTRLLRLTGRRAAATERVDRLSLNFANANRSTARMRGVLQPSYTVIMASGVLFVIWMGGERVAEGALTLGAFVGYLQLFVRFVERGFRVPQMVNSIQSGAAAYARVQPLLAPPRPVVGEAPRASFTPGYVAGSREPLEREIAAAPGPLPVELDHVCFTYDGAVVPTLVDICLRVEPGAFVAITGPVGAGKTALARIIAGVYGPDAGTVRVGGRDPFTLEARERARQVGYLPQEPYLFSGTIAANLDLFAGGEMIPDVRAAREQALRIAAMERDIHAFPHGADTEIGELGIRVSGGQRQRIALARALSASAPARPGVLLLDDPFSAVDLGTEGDIIDALEQSVGRSAPPSQRMTVVLFSHRLAAFPRADRVVVLDGGRVVEQGTHEDLVAAGQMYARVFRAQHLVGRPAGQVSS
ncbi:MAG: ABC transporter ATP-binding protein [Chloroflexota bacterium]